MKGSTDNNIESPSGDDVDRKGKRRDRDDDEGSNKRQKTSTRSGSDRGSNEKNDSQSDRTTEEFNKRNWLLMYLQYDIYDSPVPASFLRAAPPIPPGSALPSSPDRNHALQLDEYMALVLTSEISHRTNSVVHGGTLEIETLDDQHITLDVVAKTAFSSHRRDSLKHEYSIYHLLASKGVKGIPTVLGLFNDIEDGPSLLVTTNAGLPIPDENKIISAAARSDLLSTLKQIHKTGILHGDIRPGNLLIDGLGRTTIIDFGHSQKTSSAKEMRQESQELANLLIRAE